MPRGGGAAGWLNDMPPEAPYEPSPGDEAWGGVGGDSAGGCELSGYRGTDGEVSNGLSGR